MKQGNTSLRSALFLGLIACLIYGLGAGLRASIGILLEPIADMTGLSYEEVSFSIAVMQIWALSGTTVQSIRPDVRCFFHGPFRPRYQTMYQLWDAHRDPRRPHGAWNGSHCVWPCPVVCHLFCRTGALSFSCGTP